MTLSSKRIARFTALFNDSSPDIGSLLEECYHPQILFRDPLVEKRGHDALGAYLKSAYENVTQCEFDFGAPAASEQFVMLPWRMTLEHRRLASGRPIMVEGVTLLQGEDDRIIFHRDYYDAGQLLYENIPVLGGIIRWIRSKAA